MIVIGALVNGANIYNKHKV